MKNWALDLSSLQSCIKIANALAFKKVQHMEPIFKRSQHVDPIFTRSQYMDPIYN